MDLRPTRLIAALICLIAASPFSLTSWAEPFNVYLMLGNEPATSIIVQYHTKVETATTTVLYATEPIRGHRELYPWKTTGTTWQIPGLADNRWLHAVTLQNLRPATTYYFIAGDTQNGFSEERSFRTQPGGTAPFRFVIGGDMGIKDETRQLLSKAGKTNPDFAVIGGDIAYENGIIEDYAKFDTWFDHWDRYMRTFDGRMIPMICGIGNHEVNKLESDDQWVRSPFYMNYFTKAVEGVPNFTRKVNDQTVMYFLDSSHLIPHASQTEWLKSEFETYKELPNQFAVYHVPLYPSCRPYDGAGSAAGRKHWAPLFDEYRLDVGFEHHDHTFKRTKRIRNNAVHPEGVLFLGDGSFGVGARTVDEMRRWYEAIAAPVGHFWIVDIDGESQKFQAMDQFGNIFDRYPEVASP